MAKAAEQKTICDWRQWVDEPGDFGSPVLILRDPGPLPKVEIKSRGDADLALRALGDTERCLATINQMADEAINEAKKEAVEGAANPLKWKKELEKELEKYARANEKGWEGRTLTL